MATPTSSLSLPDRNAAARELLSVLADVLNLADAMGVTVMAGSYTVTGEVQVHPVERDRARELATAISDEPSPEHYSGFTTWTGQHRDVPVVVFGSYAGPAGVAS